jgi:hypothetical protein
LLHCLHCYVNSSFQLKVSNNKTLNPFLTVSKWIPPPLAHSILEINLPFEKSGFFQALNTRTNSLDIGNPWEVRIWVRDKKKSFARLHWTPVVPICLQLSRLFFFTLTLSLSLSFTLRTGFTTIVCIFYSWLPDYVKRTAKHYSNLGEKLPMRKWVFTIVFTYSHKFDWMVLNIYIVKYNSDNSYQCAK